MTNDTHRVNAERMKYLLAALSDVLPPDTLTIADELIDANESVVAFEIVCGVLDELNATVSLPLLDEMDGIAKGLPLDRSTLDVLSSLRERP